MTGEVFKKYFKNKLLVWGAIGVVVMLVRYLRGYPTSFVFATISVLILLAIAFGIGCIDYSFYEKSSFRIIANLIDKPPLSEFQAVGFIKNENNKIEGFVNNYKVILSPVVT